MPRRDEEEVAMDSGARMDTYNDDEDSYGDEDGVGGRGFGNLDDEDRLSVNMDDLQDDSDDDGGAIDLSNPKQQKEAAGGQAPTKMASASTEESKDENNTSGSDDQNKSTGGSSGGNNSTGNLFSIGES